MSMSLNFVLKENDKAGQKKRNSTEVTRSGYQVERVAADILGELSHTGRGNQNILVISDYFTKWTQSSQCLRWKHQL